MVSTMVVPVPCRFELALKFDTSTSPAASARPASSARAAAFPFLPARLAPFPRVLLLLPLLQESRSCIYELCEQYRPNDLPNSSHCYPLKVVILQIQFLGDSQKGESMSLKAFDTGEYKP